MKEEILKYLRCDRRYSSGVALVMKYSHRIGFKRMINIQHESAYLLGIIHEELRELAGITTAEMKRMMAVPVGKETAKSPEIGKPSDETQNSSAGSLPKKVKPATVPKPSGKKPAVKRNQKK